MILGIGTDIVNCKRIQSAYEKFGDHFLGRILTEKEKAQMPTSHISKQPEDTSHSSFSMNCPQWLAARFAVKEAAVKALGTGFSEGISFLDIEVLREEGKAPYITFLGNAKKKADALGVCASHVSYSHEKEFAIAYVILETSL